LYKNSLVAYLDILGLTDAIDETRNIPSKADKIFNMLAEVHNTAKLIMEGANSRWKMDIKVHVFSDSVIISYPDLSSDAFIRIAHIISAMQWVIMPHHFFFRGAVSWGGHYEQDEVYFGPAFIDALRLEKQCVWPRVIIDPVVLKGLDSSELERAAESYLIRDANGLFYLNYLHLASVVQLLYSEENDASKIDPTSAYKRHKKYLLGAVDEIKAKARVDLLSKYHSVGRYHNDHVTYIIEGLPTSDNYREIDQNTEVGELITIIKTALLTKENLTEAEADSYLSSYVQKLNKAREIMTECKINLETTFDYLYPNISDK